jgi:hypothetical protein
VPPTHDRTGRAKKNSGTILEAPPVSTTRPYRRNKIAGQFAARLIEMLESVAYRAMSLSGHRVIARIEIELAHHAGHDNGRLPVTFDDFERYGIDRHAIAPAIREVEALGFVEVSERGRAGNAEYGTPNRFRLTYRPTAAAEATNDWRNIKTIEDANARALAARKNKSPVGEKTRFSVENPHRKRQGPSGGFPHYRAGAEPPTTLDISPGGSRSAPEGSAVASDPRAASAVSQAPSEKMIELIMRTRNVDEATARRIFTELP